MADPEREDAPTTPPPAIRPPAPVSGPRAEAGGEEEPERDTDASVTELSVTEPAARNPDTLMSLPKPTPRDADALVEDWRDVEDRLGAIEARLHALEQAREPLLGGKATPWWFWLLFLLGLAVTWRLLAAIQ